MPRLRSGWILAGLVIATIVVGMRWRLSRRATDFSSRESDAIAQGLTAYAKGEWGLAETLARSVLKLNSANMAALQLMARSAARLGRDESAETIYRRLGVGGMQAEDYFLLGTGLLRRGRTDMGLKSLGAARDVEPDHAETLDALSAYWARGRSQTAAVDAAERLRKQPGWEVVGSVRVARLRAELYDPAVAAKLLSDALARDPSLARADLDPAAARRLLARWWLEAGEPAMARSVLQKWLSSAPDPEAAWLLSRACLQEGNAVEATQALAAAAGFDTTDPMTPEPAPYVGAVSCQSCHPKEYRSQQSSPHAQTLTRTAELAELPWPDRALADDDNPRAVHRFRVVNDRIEATTQVENRTFTALVEFAMGSNHQGQTFLARDPQGRVCELRVSRYPTAPKWGRTMEHPAVLPEPSDYLGRPISEDAARRCLNCHSTDFQAVQKAQGRPEARDRGIGCERCHGPGGNHVRAADLQFSESAIKRPRLATADQVVALCGQCHKAPESSSLDEPRAVRFQEPSVLASRCYTESRGTFSCVTCHNPHQKAERSAAFYESKCLACHPAPGALSIKHEAANQKTWSPCSVNPRDDCLSCHMPKVRNAIRRAVFTDHRIRIHRVREPGAGVATARPSR